VFQQKIATLDALKARGIIDKSIGIPCVFCLYYDESCDHLFISCPFANSVWTDFYHWLGVDSVRAVRCVDNFVNHRCLFKEKQWRRWKHLFWFSVLWSLWSARNNSIFNGMATNSSVVLLKTMSLFSDWLLNPISCLNFVLLLQLLLLVDLYLLVVLGFSP
jgi:hypothetical protein